MLIRLMMIMKSRFRQNASVSYTNNGCSSLENEFRLQSNGVIEDYVDILTWYHFLLAQLVKPYQTSFPGVGINQISTIDFSDDKEKSFGHRTKCYKHSDKALYLSSSSMLLKDFASECWGRDQNANRGRHDKPNLSRNP